MELLGFHREMIRIHKNYPALRTGSLIMLSHEPGFLSYARFNEDSAVIVAVNNNSEDREFVIPVRKAGITDEIKLVRIMKTDRAGYWPDAVIFFPKDGCIKLWLSAESGVVLKNMQNDERDILPDGK